MRVDFTPSETTKPKHTYKFTRDEVVSALRNHAIALGENVPDGEFHLWGLKKLRRHHDDEESLTLEVVDVTT